MVDACMRQLAPPAGSTSACAPCWSASPPITCGCTGAPGLFLARQFLDFEPGIHWSQMQMQSGTTGINTLRIYSPAKQARDHDPLGEYVRRWVPEYGTAAYPDPIVDEKRRWPRPRMRSTASAAAVPRARKPTPSRTSMARARAACPRPPSAARARKCRIRAGRLFWRDARLIG
jgi:hypothetical protein